MRILTILFLLISILSLGGRTYLGKTTSKFYKELIEALKTRGDTDIRNTFFEKCETYYVFVFLTIICLITAITQLIYMCFAIKYDPFLYIALGYLIYQFASIIVSRIRTKNQFAFTDVSKYSLEGAVEKLEEQITKLNKFKFRILLSRILDLLYFGYMFYVLFVR